MWKVSSNLSTPKGSKNNHGDQCVPYFLIGERSLHFDLEGLFYGFGIVVFMSLVSMWVKGLVQNLRSWSDSMERV